MVVGGREKKKRVELDGTRAFLHKAVRDVHRVFVATLFVSQDREGACCDCCRSTQ